MLALFSFLCSLFAYGYSFVLHFEEYGSEYRPVLEAIEVTRFGKLQVCVKLCAKVLKLHLQGLVVDIVLEELASLI